MALRFELQLFLLVFIAYHASSCEQEEYWKMKLPNVPMPQAIKDNLFHSHDIEPSKIIDTKEKKVYLDQPWTVVSWHYDERNAEDKAKVKGTKSTTIDAKQKKFSLDQPWTAVSWHYDVDKANDKAKVKEIESSTIDTKEKKVSSDQPWTVVSWRYDEDNAKDKAKGKDIELTTVDTKEKKISLDQPWTVVSWRYDADNAKDKAKGKDIKSSTIDTREKKAGLDQPWTVVSWRYHVDDAKDKEKVKDIKSSTTKTEEKKVSLDQPWTVVSWRYDGDNAKDKAKAKDIGSFATDTKDKKVDQPWTVVSWRYDVDNAKDKSKVKDTELSTIDTKEKKVSLDQPWTVVSWRYDADNAKDKAKVKDIESFTKEKKVSLYQPWTVVSWHYDADNAKDKAKVKEESSKGISHHHHHVMHNKLNSNDAQQDLSGGSIFFMEKSLRLGMKLKHDFQKTPKIPFLPQHLAQSIPFSVHRFAEILDLFSIKSDSAKAVAIKETLDVCLQRPKVRKENRTCAQSIEDVVDFVAEELGTNNVELRMMRNDIEVINGIQDYVITKVKKLVVPGKNAVACHRMSYPYVVYYCHHQQDIGHYDVTLVNPTLGSAIQTTAVCHYDTYAWQADVPALRYLGIRPGDSPVCHFSAINDMFWTIKDNSKSLDMAQLK